MPFPIQGVSQKLEESESRTSLCVAGGFLMFALPNRLKIHSYAPNKVGFTFIC